MQVQSMIYNYGTRKYMQHVSSEQGGTGLNSWDLDAKPVTVNPEKGLGSSKKKSTTNNKSSAKATKKASSAKSTKSTSTSSKAAKKSAQSSKEQSSLSKGKGVTVRNEKISPAQSEQSSKFAEGIAHKRAELFSERAAVDNMSSRSVAANLQEGPISETPADVQEISATSPEEASKGLSKNGACSFFGGVLNFLKRCIS